MGTSVNTLITLITLVQITLTNRLGWADNVGWQQRPPPLEDVLKKDGTGKAHSG